MGAQLGSLAAGAVALAMIVIVADAFVAPRSRSALPVRRGVGIVTLLLVAALAFAILLTLAGTPSVAAVGVTALAFALSLVSNVKRKVLGEPLVFSDFALIGAVFQQPQFYLSALRPWQIGVLAAGFAGIAASMVVFSSTDPMTRFAGLGLGLGAWAGLMLVLPRLSQAVTAPIPDAEIDVERLGLAASLLAHWFLWRGSPDPSPCEAAPIAGQSGQLVVIVQCESFTDPGDLLGDSAPVLPGLQKARELAWRSGRLLVSGFGAYTMRTEYGVLFGRDEALLGARRFDPFLTARGEASWALPNRLDRSDWDSHFVHPHDLRFYGRDRLMPEIGFGTLVGDDSFPSPPPNAGRYVTDAAVTERILELADTGPRARLIYAVTIENHGPWSASDKNGSPAIASYLRLLSHSDAMLDRLLEALPRLGRPATLCFFGDHRPSIPGVSEPGQERHTPYVIVRFAADGSPIRGPDDAQDLIPAELHHVLLEVIRSGEAEAQQKPVS
ncbi:MAG: LTA synthase family protein [Sphingomonadales bacterium]|nr:MAG: LTA synthase family protein [Sphingomonadales bacterium]